MENLKKESHYTSYDSEAQAFDQFHQEFDILNSPNLENVIRNLDSQAYQDLCGRLESLRNSLIKLEPFLGPDENESKVQNRLYSRYQATNDEFKNLSKSLNFSNPHLRAKITKQE